MIGLLEMDFLRQCLASKLPSLNSLLLFVLGLEIETEKSEIRKSEFRLWEDDELTLLRNCCSLWRQRGDGLFSWFDKQQLSI